MNDKTVTDLYGTTSHHRYVGEVLLRRNFQMFKDFSYRQIQRLVDDDSHGTALSVFTDIGNTVGKNALGQSRHGQQKMIPKAVAASGCIDGKLSGHTLKISSRELLADSHRNPQFYLELSPLSP